MPWKLKPGTPSMLAGSTRPCQWIDVGSASSLRTRIVTVSPSRQRNVGAGSEPLTTVAIRGAARQVGRALADREIELRAPQHLRASSRATCAAAESRSSTLAAAPTPKPSRNLRREKNCMAFSSS